MSGVVALQLLPSVFANYFLGIQNITLRPSGHHCRIWGLDGAEADDLVNSILLPHMYLGIHTANVDAGYSQVVPERIFCIVKCD